MGSNKYLERHGYVPLKQAIERAAAEHHQTHAGESDLPKDEPGGTRQTITKTARVVKPGGEIPHSRPSAGS